MKILVKSLDAEYALRKSGEGSRGGTVIGHTRSGKPIYDTHDHPEHVEFTKEDHNDAFAAHYRLANNSTDSVAQDNHYKQSTAHANSAKRVRSERQHSGDFDDSRSGEARHFRDARRRKYR